MATRPDRKTITYIGYNQADYTTAYARFYNEKIVPLLASVTKSMEDSPFPANSLPPLDNANYLMKSGYLALETGYTLESGGSARVAVLTQMPNVSPKMWDWWFGWHGSLANRYKLWHPKAHQSAEWKDGNANLEAYIGRTSMIEEYIGKKLEKANIRFISPTELGFEAQDLVDKNKVVLICARVGYTHFPLDYGWLVHQVRATEGGAEMRSRFWIGGQHIQIRANWFLPNLLSKILQKIYRLPDRQAADLLAHCSEEMNHLAAFLPDIYAELHK